MIIEFMEMQHGWHSRSRRQSYDRRRPARTASVSAGRWRATDQGKITAYVNDGVAVLTEILCETDFVAKTDDFKALAKDLCLHVAAANPAYLNREEVPEEEVSKERDVATAQAEASTGHSENC